MEKTDIMESKSCRKVQCLARNCPFCGVKIEGIAEQSNHCPACGRELVRKRTEKEIENEVRSTKDRTDMLLFFGIAGIFFGFMLLLPDIILLWVIGLSDGVMIFWPINAILVLLGVLLLIIRYPYAKKHKEISRIYLQIAEESLICSYCGCKNITGYEKCEFCGAPVNPANTND